MKGQGVMNLTYELTHCYLEVARGAMTAIHHPSLTRDEFLEAHGPNPLANAIFSAVSITVLYSYLAIESFINYQLYRVWERRHDGSPEANQLLTSVGDVEDFESLKTHGKIGELGERIKTICEILGYKKPHEEISQVWQEFKELVEVSRHFFQHPYPGKNHFQENVERIFMQTESGKYVQVAEKLIGYLYESGGQTAPEWLSTNTLIGFRGIDMLVGKNAEE
jgi:hypothetical protein